METIETIINGYRARMQQADRTLDSLQRRIYRISTLRLLLFAAGVAGLIVLRSESWAVLAGIALVTFVPFVGLIKYHNRLFARKDYLEKEKEVNRQEAAALADYDTSAFDDGQDFADPAHLYTFDLDVFGPRSLFQHLNRTCTQPGKNRLAAWLERKEKSAKPGFYDGMLTEDPNRRDDTPEDGREEDARKEAGSETKPVDR